MSCRRARWPRSSCRNGRARSGTQSPMTALCKPYDSAADAEKAVDDLIAAGVPGTAVRLLRGAEIHDARREARGRFAGSVAPDEQVGAYAGPGPERRAARGSFA